MFGLYSFIAFADLPFAELRILILFLGFIHAFTLPTSSERWN